MAKIGFTGSRHGMTDRQWEVVRGALNGHQELHHGDCIGADEQVHSLGRSITGMKIVSHPPTKDSLRAFCKADVTLSPKDFLARNKDIVNATDILIATPSSKMEVLRSGTWSTIRYAWKMKKKFLIVFPDGTSVDTYNRNVSN